MAEPLNLKGKTPDNDPSDLLVNLVLDISRMAIAMERLADTMDDISDTMEREALNKGYMTQEQIDERYEGEEDGDNEPKKSA